MSSRAKLVLNIFLLALVILDVVLAILAIGYPQTWFDLFHGAPYVDPQGLLLRTGALWAAFALWQFVAFLCWRSQPYWLPLVAGIRLTEVFSDWTYLWVAESITWYGRVGLFLAPPGNVVFAIALIWAYRRLLREQNA